MSASLRRLAPWLVMVVLLVAMVRVGVAAAALAGTVFSGTVSGNDQGFLAGASVVIDGPVHKGRRPTPMGASPSPTCRAGATS